MECKYFLTTVGSSKPVARSEANIGETDQTSVKVHAAPGGKTSIDLFGGYGKDEDVKPTSKIGAGVHKEEEKEEDAKKEEGTAAGYKKADSHTSIKVRQPPGGASSITF